MYRFDCPYCHQEITDDLYDFDLLSEEPFFFECPHCEKIIKMHSSVMIDVWPTECKCQLENHEYELSLACPNCCSTMMCKHCGDERPLTEEERKKYNIQTKTEYLESLEKDCKK